MDEQGLSQGRKLSDTEAFTLEKLLEKQPDDLQIRLKLLAYYGRNSRQDPQRVTHTLWLISSYPDSDVWINPELNFEEEDCSQINCQKLIRAWLAQVEKQPNNSQIMSNAAHFLFSIDEMKVIELLERAEKINNQDVTIPSCLSNIYFKRFREDSKAQRVQNATLALEASVRALKLQEIDSVNRRLCPPHFLLKAAAESALHLSLFDEAESFAKELKKIDINEEADELLKRISSGRENAPA